MTTSALDLELYVSLCAVIKKQLVKTKPGASQKRRETQNGRRGVGGWGRREHEAEEAGRARVTQDLCASLTPGSSSEAPETNEE